MSPSGCRVPYLGPVYDGACSEEYQYRYGLFPKLPKELIQKILQMVIGDNSIHIDFRLQKPLSAAGPAARSSHDRVPPRAETRANYERVHKREWQWYASICRRDPAARPGEDACLLRRTRYDDGIEVLYATNTFIIDSRDLMLELMKQSLTGAGSVYNITSRGVRFITSLELRLSLPDDLGHRNPHLLRADVLEFGQLLRHLPGAFATLRKMYIVFESWAFGLPVQDWRGQARRLADDYSFKPLSIMAENMSLSSFDVEIPSRLYDDVADERRQGSHPYPFCYPVNRNSGDAVSVEWFRVIRAGTPAVDAEDVFS
ncbi:hypothetical protein C8035_v011051 [Colletotrichum spinosum]|uniref:Uncharacterized protein n=1 Tax=Colletotrichum spinosum TaxID=1347390 RepID=A0A4R8Q648_9PEZI|nr:hypothetical protein C8035_v011051 [Colletotrichum spinosum]